ncbi:MAG: hypothetical protein IPK07_15175 [Deltaproteobacteria bacterium]|nr:hypothetical protein [Deltaproteobacteria bacterium]
MIEDLVLAQAIKKAGKNLVYAQGVELARLRMYRSLDELWRGWSKNFHVSVKGNVVLAVLERWRCSRSSPRRGSCRSWGSSAGSGRSRGRTGSA